MHIRRNLSSRKRHYEASHITRSLCDSRHLSKTAMEVDALEITGMDVPTLDFSGVLVSTGELSFLIDGVEVADLSAADFTFL